MSDTPALLTQALTRRFGDRAAVDKLDLHVPQGAIYGFLGRNGAGKTTTIRLATGLLRPTSGSLRVFGHDVARDRRAAAALTGSLLEARATYDHLSGHENLDLTRLMLGLPNTEIDRVLDIVDLRDAALRKVGHYSLGMRQRLGLARALLGNPKLLILDEPMNGLDPDGIRDMRAVIRAMPETCGATVFLSSHLLSEVQQIVTHVGLIDNGRLVLQGVMDDLLDRAAPAITLRTGDDIRAAEVLIAAGFRVAVIPVGLSVDATTDTAASAVVRLLVAAGIDVIELSRPAPTLEALYMSVRNGHTQATYGEAA